MTFVLGQRVRVVDEPWYCGETEQATGYVGQTGGVVHLPTTGRVGVQLHDGMWYFQPHQIVDDVPEVTYVGSPAGLDLRDRCKEILRLRRGSTSP